jgi:hypothetical protein
MKFLNKWAFSRDTTFYEENPDIYSDVMLGWITKHDWDENKLAHPYSYKASKDMFSRISLGYEQFDQPHPSFWNKNL